MTKFEQAQKERKRAETQLANVAEQLAELKGTLDRYYELVRWQELGCTEEEYEKLTDNMLYEYEWANIDTVLEKLIDFANPETRKNIPQKY